MSKWTPGPWAYRRTHPLSDDMWFVVLDRDWRGPVVDVGGDDFAGQIAEAKYLITDPVEIEANARLISEAPAMAEELAHLLALIEPALESGVTIPGLATMNRTRALIERINK